MLFKRNLINLKQAQELIAEIKLLSRIEDEEYNRSTLIAIDEEGGRVSRLPPPFTRGRPALDFSEHQDENGLISQVLYQSSVAKGIGIDVLLSPVADILTHEPNLALGDRCFGRDAETVSHYASLVHQTISKNGLFSCAKHFPGHGNTHLDSHKDFSISSATLKELNSREWLPFQRLIQENIKFIMSAHVLLPELDPKNPATLSFKILNDYLRIALNFNGLILSDDLRMNAIAYHYGYQKDQESSIVEEQKSSVFQDENYLKQASVDALQAGCDILLSCQSISREKIIFNGILEYAKQFKSFQYLLLKKAWRIYCTIF